jgi:hypothetical protein
LIRVNSNSPAVSISSPPPRTGRTPKRLTSLPAREAMTPIVTVIGRKISPV